MSADAALDWGPCADMAEVRRRVDALDAQLVPLLARRLQCMREAARLKPRRELVRDEARIQQVLEQVQRHAQAQPGMTALEMEVLIDVYRELIERCIAYELRCFDAKLPQELRP
ncbi:CM-like: chorismate mutase related enzyme [Tepidimonas alkaliphilus]|uniref:chorismate mutase n=1 Tax=Tepidimonas alkaliphilus TaxID=2588942 RepID=A0A554W7E5_9BURK|nr:chorismate mutase [Tepidimonas alkaliphilus]TSE19503.1 CM-like: chorismate mutase related enzyme [Tepidimonas alkaliphilus]